MSFPEIADEPDISTAAVGASDDNRNGVPDECELLGDCNHNFAVDLDDARLLATVGWVRIVPL